MSGYNILHGNAVAKGLKLILQASKKHGFIDQKTFDACIVTLKKCVGENTDIDCEYDIRSLVDVAMLDKKRDGNFINVVMVKGVGNCTIEKVNTTELLEYFL